MFAKILKKEGAVTGWSAYWKLHPHHAKDINDANKDSANQLHELYVRQVAESIGHSPIADKDIEHVGDKTKIKTSKPYQLGQGVIDHLRSKGFEHTNMARSGTDSIYTLEHPKTKEKVKVGYFHGFGKTLSGKGMPSRVEISHVQG